VGFLAERGMSLYNLKTAVLFNYSEECLLCALAINIRSLLVSSLQEEHSCVAQYTLKKNFTAVARFYGMKNLG